MRTRSTEYPGVSRTLLLEYRYSGVLRVKTVGVLRNIGVGE
jgi:hypothetical protein